MQKYSFWAGHFEFQYGRKLSWQPRLKCFQVHYTQTKFVEEYTSKPLCPCSLCNWMFLVRSMLSIYQTIQSNKEFYHSVLCNTAENIYPGTRKNNLFSMVLASPIFTLTSKWPWFDLQLEFKVKLFLKYWCIQKPVSIQFQLGVICCSLLYMSYFRADFVTPTPQFVFTTDF